MKKLVQARRRGKQCQAKQEAEEQTREEMMSLAASNQTECFPQHVDNVPASGAGASGDVETYFNGLLECSCSQATSGLSGDTTFSSRLWLGPTSGMVR